MPDFKLTYKFITSFIDPGMKTIQAIGPLFTTLFGLVFLIPITNANLISISFWLIQYAFIMIISKAFLSKGNLKFWLLFFFRIATTWFICNNENKEIVINCFAILSTALIQLLLRFTITQYNIQQLFIFILSAFYTIWVSFERPIQILSNLPPEEREFHILNFMKIQFVGLMGQFIAVGVWTHGVNKSLEKSIEETETSLKKLKSYQMALSHELRNPLNSLLGNLNLALEETNHGKIQNYLSTAKICGEYLLYFINNILDTGKAEFGILEVTPSQISIRQCLKKTWEISKHIIEKKGIQPIYKLGPDVPEILVLDQYRLNQILFNLISNSVKFTQKGHVKISIDWKCAENSSIEDVFSPKPYENEDNSITEMDENIPSPYSSFVTSSHDTHKGYLKIVVEDTGCGMDPQELLRLFKKFSQVSLNQRQKQIGSGLGLYISMSLCKAMGGEIRAYSRLGRGSTFIAVIPTQEFHNDVQTISNHESKIKYLSEKRLRILVGEWDKSSSDSLIACLKSIESNFDVFRFESDLFDHFTKLNEEGQRIDLMILDNEFMTSDGRKICNELRKYEKVKKLMPTKIIILTNNENRLIIDRLVDKSGMFRVDKVYKKPLSVKTLQQKLYELINDS